MVSDEHVDSFLSKSNIMVFHPTIDEFKDFSKYVEYMEDCGAAKWGIAKIIPPKGWKPCRSLKSKLNKKKLMISNPILQEISSTHSGIYQQMNIEQPAISLEVFEKMAMSEGSKPPHGPLDFVEQRYWRGLTFNPSLYGADVEGSLYDRCVKEWNISKLGDVLEEVTNKLNVKIPGVNSPYLYFGMWKTTFPWHVEDMDLYSINYLHYGKPKFWYAIPHCHGTRFETMIRGVYPEFFKVCPEFLRHKMTIVSPKNLARNGIPVNRMVQRAGEFIITFPHGYHSGFNMGYNAAESANFALHRWVDIGKMSKFCVCYSDTVSINMDHFIDEYNVLYHKNIAKCIRKTPKKTVMTAQNDELLKKMRPRRKLTEYRSENNTRAIARRARYRQKMKYKRRKIKRWRSRMLLKKGVKRANTRNLVIDPLSDLDCQIMLDSDDEMNRKHQTAQPTTSSLKIVLNDPPKCHYFPSKWWFLRALCRIEKDFTLRGENVPLRSAYVRPSRETSPSAYYPAEPDTPSHLHHNVMCLEQPNAAVKLEKAIQHTCESIIIKPKKRSSKKKRLEISLDLPESFLGNSASFVDSGFDELITSLEDLPGKENKRKTRKNKGGRPNKLEQLMLQKKEEQNIRVSQKKINRVPYNVSVLWEPTTTFNLPCTLTLSDQNVYHCTVATTVDPPDQEYNVEDTMLTEPAETERRVEALKSDWRLCMIHAKAKADKPSKRQKYLGEVRKRGRPTFGSSGPSLNQEKINAINEETSIESSYRRLKMGKRINVKLKDLIIFDKKIIASNIENRDRNGRLKMSKVRCAYSGYDSMLRIVWMFDHTYSLPNTLLSPQNVVTVPVGDNRYKIIHVNAEEQTTKSFTGRSFVNEHTKWAPRILSLGHNIMAIFNYQAYAGMGFSFDDTASYPEPSVVRHVSSDLCRKILEQRQHIIQINGERKKTRRDRKCRRSVTVGPSLEDDQEPRLGKRKRKRTESPQRQHTTLSHNLSDYAEESLSWMTREQPQLQLKIKSVQSVKPNLPIVSGHTHRSETIISLDQFNFSEQPVNAVPSAICRKLTHQVPRTECQFDFKETDVLCPESMVEQEVIESSDLGVRQFRGLAVRGEYKGDYHLRGNVFVRGDKVVKVAELNRRGGNHVDDTLQIERALKVNSFIQDMSSRVGANEVHTSSGSSDKESVDEKHIQWCLQTNNIDDFRVWDAQEKISVLGGPAIPPQFGYQVKRPAAGTRIMKSEEKDRFSRMIPGVAGSSLFPELDVSSQVNRRGGWREQELLGRSPTNTMCERDGQVKELVTIYNPPTSFDPSLDKLYSSCLGSCDDITPSITPSTPSITPSTPSMDMSQLTRPVSSIIPVPGLTGLMPNPDSYDYQLYKSNFNRTV